MANAAMPWSGPTTGIWQKATYAEPHDAHSGWRSPDVQWRDRATAGPGPPAARRRRHDCVERGYLLFPLTFRAIHDGDVTTASTTFEEAAEPSPLALSRVLVA